MRSAIAQVRPDGSGATDAGENFWVTALPYFDGRVATMSISTRASRARAVTPMQIRAGRLSLGK
jgi:hypothetical protein